MNFANLRNKAQKNPNNLELNKDECTVVLNLIGDSNIKVRNIQQVYDLVYKLQEFVQKEQN